MTPVPYRDPEDRRRYDRERRRAMRAAASPTPLVVPAEVRILVTGDLERLLREAVRLVLGDDRARDIEKGRALGTLAGIGLRLLEARDLERRLDAVEQAVKLRSLRSASA